MRSEDLPITQKSFGERAFRRLVGWNLARTYGDLTRIQEGHLLVTRGLGRGTVLRIKTELAKYGLALKSTEAAILEIKTKGCVHQDRFHCIYTDHPEASGQLFTKCYGRKTCIDVTHYGIKVFCSELP